MAWTVSSVRVRAPRIALFLGLIAGSLASFPSPLSAQTVSPRIVEFDPSPDHNASVNGVAVVREYELRFFAVGSTQPLHVIELGKPTVGSDGKIRFNFAALLGAWPVAGVVYQARVAALGPGGSSQSAISNQFVFGTTSEPPHPHPHPHLPAAATSTDLLVQLVDKVAFGKLGFDNRHCRRHSGHRLRVERVKRFGVVDDHQRLQRQRRQIGRLLGFGQFDEFPARRPPDDCRRHIHVHSGGSGVRVLALADLAQCWYGDNDWKRRRDCWQRLRVDRHQLGRLADDHGRRERQRQRDRKLQRGCQQRVDGPLGDADGWYRDVHADAERLVHLCRESKESRLQSLGR